MQRCNQNNKLDMNLFDYKADVTEVLKPSLEG